MNSVRERIGFVVGDGHSMNAAVAITKIVAAEAAGIRQVWMNQEYLDMFPPLPPAQPRLLRHQPRIILRAIIIRHTPTANTSGTTVIIMEMDGELQLILM